MCHVSLLTSVSLSFFLSFFFLPPLPPHPQAHLTEGTKRTNISGPMAEAVAMGLENVRFLGDPAVTADNIRSFALDEVLDVKGGQPTMETLLGRQGKDLKDVAVKWLQHYRPGGHFLNVD